MTEGIAALQGRLSDFAKDRDWGQFHTPKNLAMALAVEVGELLEFFQWATPGESAAIMDDPASAARVREELADVFAYLLRLADVLGVALDEALLDKIRVNGAKYPVDRSRGTSRKYTDL